MRKRIPVSEPFIESQDVEFVGEKLSEKQVSGRASVVKDFEGDFSKYLGVKHSAACSNGTTALHLAVRALGLKQGDEVIAPAFTMMSPILALLYEKVTPVLIDVDRECWVMDPSQIARKITKRTKAILAVHSYGNPVQMDVMMEVAHKNGLFVIEDCAESLGSTYRDKRTGTFGDISTFSFFANKLITSGEGGMVCTNDSELADRVDRLHDLYFGKSNKFLHDALGYNYRMSALQAALGLSQLRHIDDHLLRIRRIAALYDERLSDEARLAVHKEPPNTMGSYWMYSVVLKGVNREFVVAKLAEDGIETRPFFVPAHLQPVCTGLFPNERYPVSEYLSESGLNLPSAMSLKEEDVRSISESLLAAVRSPGL